MQTLTKEISLLELVRQLGETPVPTMEQYDNLQGLKECEYADYLQKVQAGETEERATDSFYFQLLCSAFNYGRMEGKREERAKRKRGQQA